VVEKLVIIADNDAEVHRAFETGMAVQHFRTVTAAEHQQLLALARAERPHLIITDVGMRRSDGFAVIKQLKTDPTTATIPVLAVMGLCSPEVQHRAQTAGSDALLFKPVTATTLAQVAHLLMERAALLHARALRSTAAAASSRHRAADAHTGMPRAEKDAARLQPSAHATASMPRCHGCGSDAHSKLVRTTRSSLTYQCDACHHRWRRTFKPSTASDG
jgi:CheY-like chemotaxis protein